MNSYRRFWSENVQGPGCHIDPSEVILPGCSCYTHSCQRESSSCLQTYGQTYDRLSPGPEEILSIVTAGLCLSVTPCVAVVRSAGNRVVQRGLGLRLCVYPTEDRGLGAPALEPISCGTFVCEYAGKVLGFEEARRRTLAQGPEDNNYIIAVREYAGQGPVNVTFVDPIVVENVGRFLNHSFQPNLFMVPSMVFATPVQKIHLKNSDPGTEASGTDTLQRKPYRCGAQNCAQFLPLDISVLNN
uniref:SET domain and mariner transposase fusion gene n=1 Tax=Salmo trutta TaxID=8032 RepID=A0A674C4Y9_SALTR